ncbi:hypothetical protein L1987_73275 [Smallanthus sonchifolius]|uniref:Uncharacterized protein n=1 Tax=Smallanthus sonchifolius TaxID=185202 RepID=A0ACB9A074_9ASTR|nr:hypothetical protein L1987_73275 [Smallanthus sonchifolius]
MSFLHLLPRSIVSLLLPDELTEIEQRGGQMDLINDGSSIITEEDRISNLPDDITYHNLPDDITYHNERECSDKFGKFVVHALYHRNNLAEVSAVKLKFRGSTTRFFVEDIVNYAYLHNLRQLTISGNQQELPQCLFSSHTLKHLTLINRTFSSWNSCTPNSAWDFPALETLNLTCMRLGDGSEKNLNLFSKCVNLKDITLHKCSMKGLEVFNVCVPHLSNFTITENTVLPKVFNMVAPQLETVTASASVSICSEGLAACSNFLHLSTAGFNALEKVNISLSNSRLKKERHVPSLLELFRTLRTVKFLILDVDVIEVHIDTVTKKAARLEAEETQPVTMIEEKRTLEAKVHSHDQVIAQQKAKIRMQDQAIAQQKAKAPGQFQVNGKQIAKIRMQDQVIEQQRAKIQVQFQQRTMFKAKMQTQDQFIAKLKNMLVAQNLQHGKLILQIINCKMAELKVHVESGNPDYEIIRSVGRDIKSAMDLIPWNIKHSERFHSNHSHSQSHVHAVELSAAPRPSPANVSFPFTLQPCLYIYDPSCKTNKICTQLYACFLTATLADDRILKSCVVRKQQGVPISKELLAGLNPTSWEVEFNHLPVQLSTEGFDSLEKVNLSLSMPHYEQKRFVPLLLDLFHKLHCTKYLVINLDIIEVTQKRSRKQVQDETMAKKVAKLKPQKKQ